MQTLTYGLKRPDSGDKGDVFFPALEENITQLDAHTHDGVTSPKIPSSSVEAVSQNVAAASWSDQGGDIYRALVTMPGSLQFDTSTLSFEINSGSDVGSRFFPSVTRVSANSFYVFINDDSLDIKVIYS